MLQDVLRDARALNIDTGVACGEIEALYAEYGKYFEEVNLPRLVHWDLWEGNVFIKNGRITRLIDFVRCLWADSLMEVGFRTDRQNKDFPDGYGIGEFTSGQTARIVWYDLYLYLISSLEYDYRKYPDNGILLWSREKIKKTVALLRGGLPDKAERDRGFLP